MVYPNRMEPYDNKAAKMDEITTAMRTKLEQAGIPFEAVKVFGRIRCNVHVTCVGRDTADKWALLLAKVFGGAAPHVCATMWEAKDNRGGCLNPTMRKGFLVSVAA